MKVLESVCACTDSVWLEMHLYVKITPGEGLCTVLNISQQNRGVLTQIQVIAILHRNSVFIYCLFNTLNFSVIVVLITVGRLSDASVCYELAIQSHPDELPFRCGVLKNDLALGKLSSGHSQCNDYRQVSKKLPSHHVLSMCVTLIISI